jgi:hypothetical protein
VVESQETEFIFPERLLIENSTWFRNEIFKHNATNVTVGIAVLKFHQSRVKTIFRRNDNIHAFNQFYHWIHGQGCRLPTRDAPDPEDNSEASEWLVLYSLAMELDVADLALEAETRYAHASRHWKSSLMSSDIHFIYSYPETTQALRKLVITKVCQRMFRFNESANLLNLVALFLENESFTIDVLTGIRHSLRQDYTNEALDCADREYAFDAGPFCGRPLKDNTLELAALISKDANDIPRTDSDN